MWELIIQGAITPGKDDANPTLPWFRATEYGRKVLEAERFVPHDAAGYLREVQVVAGPTIGAVMFAYLEEALRCFTRGCYVASVLFYSV